MLKYLKPEIANMLAATHDNDDLACDSSLFNAHIEIIQKAIGQECGDLAGVFFSNAEWFDKYNAAVNDINARYQLIMEYVMAEISAYCAEDEVCDHALDMVEDMDVA